MRSGVALWRTLFITLLLLMVMVASGRDRVFGEGGTWTTKAPMPTARFDLGVGVINGILYAVGGRTLSPREYLSTVEAYDPASNTWTVKAPMPTARDGFAVGEVNGILYAVGGSAPTPVGWLSTVETYDPISNTWTTKAPLLTPRAGLGVGVVNGILYAVGGSSPGTGPVGTVEAYNPTTNRWTAKAPMPSARVGVAVGVVDGILYAVGGRCCDPGESSRTLRTVEAYNPATNTWTVKAPVPTPRYGHAVGVVNGILYAVGGALEGKGATVEAYDPTKNRWTVSTPMPAGRSLLAVGVVNGILYAVGGLGSVQTTYEPPLRVTLEGSNFALKVRP